MWHAQAQVFLLTLVLLYLLDVFQCFDDNNPRLIVNVYK